MCVCVCVNNLYFPWITSSPHTLPPSSAPGDYVTTTQLLVFGPAVTQINVSLPIADDDVNEAVEQFMVELVFDGDSSIVLAPSTAVVMIVDDDGKTSGSKL